MVGLEDYSMIQVVNNRKVVDQRVTCDSSCKRGSKELLNFFFLFYSTLVTISEKYEYL